MKIFHQLPQLVVGLSMWIGATASAQQPGSDTMQPSSKLEYPLNAKCGPWMVMVKSFQGPEAVDLANRLARELREKKKMNAYTYLKKSENGEVNQASYTRGHVRQYLTAAVLAGDFKDEKAAAKAQDLIHNWRPDTITKDMVPMYQWKAGPLRTAFCMPNPLAPAEPPKPDKVLSKMNSGPQNLTRCSGDYTLEVALFTGGIAFTEKDAKKLEKTSLLQAAGEHAEVVTDELRRLGFDAYVYHGLTYSLVSVGSFSSPQDPQILQLAGQVASMKVRGFDLSPAPRLMEVPRQ